MPKREFHNQEHTSDLVTAGCLTWPICTLLHGQSQPYHRGKGKHEQTKDQVVRHGIKSLSCSIFLKQIWFKSRAIGRIQLTQYWSRALDHVMSDHMSPSQKYKVFPQCTSSFWCYWKHKWDVFVVKWCFCQSLSRTGLENIKGIFDILNKFSSCCGLVPYSNSFHCLS